MTLSNFQSHAWFHLLLTWFIWMNHVVQPQATPEHENTDRFVVNHSLTTDPQSSLDIQETIQTVRFECELGHHWIVPATFPPKLESELIDIQPLGDTRGGSQLIIQLPTNPSVRRNLRGLYQCCSPPKYKTLLGIYPEWKRRSPEPLCCPCCPWFDQEKCLINNKQKTMGYNICSYGVFLFTGFVPEHEVRVEPIPDQPVLIPCANPTDSPETRPQIHAQLVPNGPITVPWFSNISSETYNSRVGFCVKPNDLSRSLPYLRCIYPQSNQSRTIRLQWPNPAPTVAPQIQLRLIELRFDGNITEARVFVANETHWRQSMEERPIYRLPQSAAVGRLRAQCIASYAQRSIVRRPPGHLCFRWRFWKLPIEESEKGIEPNTPTDEERTWNPTICTEIMRDQTTSSIVYATNEIELPSISNQDLVVECEVATPSRHAPLKRHTIHIQQQNGSHRSSQSDPEPDWSIRIIQPYRSMAIRIGQNPITSTVHFWTNQKMTHSLTSPSGPIRNGTNSSDDYWPKRTIRYCKLTFPTVSIGGYALLDFDYGYGKGSVQIYTNPGLSQTPLAMSSVHSFMFQSLDLTCEEKHNEQSPIQLFDLENATKYSWNVHRNESVMAASVHQSRRHHLNLNSPQSSDHVPVRNNTNLQKIPVRGAVEFCVKCSLSNPSSLKEESNQKCQPLLDANANRPEKQQDSVLFLIQQPTVYPKLTQLKQEVEIIDAAVLQITCIHLFQTHHAPEMSSNGTNVTWWPFIKFDKSSQLIHALSRDNSHRTCFLTPYSRGIRLHLDLKKSTHINETIICHSSGSNYAQTHLVGHQPQLPRILTSFHHIDYNHLSNVTTVRLICSALGLPAPRISWEQHILNETTAFPREWKVLRHCPPRDEHTLLGTTICEHHMTFYSLEVNRTMMSFRCNAQNPSGNVHAVVNLFPSIVSQKLHAIAYSQWSSISPLLFGIGLLLLLAMLVVLAIVYLRYTRPIRNWIKGASLLNRTQNTLYRGSLIDMGGGHKRLIYEPAHSITPEQERVMNNVLQLLGSREEVNYWLVPDDLLERSSQRIGSGHYGQVSKAWLHSKYLIQRDPQSITGTERYILSAIKIASGEMSSLSCLRNEIALLPKLRNGPNLVRMIGLTVGTQESLADCVLIMEYCVHRSLSEFVRRNSSHLRAHTSASATQKRSINSYDSGVYSWSEMEQQFGDQSPVRELIPMESPLVERGQWSSQKGDILNNASDDHQLSLFDLYRISHGIARGLTYLSSQGVIHRDLASRNVLINEAIEPRICDFGLAVCVHGREGEGDNSNSATRDESYKIITHQKQLPFRILPPEALQDQLFYLTSDVWQYALLLWQLFHLEKRKPFAEVTSAETLLRILNESVQTPQTASLSKILEQPCLVHQRLWEMMREAWQWDHRKRPLAREFEQLLERLIQPNSHFLDDDEEGNTQVVPEQSVTYTEIVQLQQG